MNENGWLAWIGLLAAAFLLVFTPLLLAARALLEGTIKLGGWGTFSRSQRPKAFWIAFALHVAGAAGFGWAIVRSVLQ